MGIYSLRFQNCYVNEHLKKHNLLIYSLFYFSLKKKQKREIIFYSYYNKYNNQKIIYVKHTKNKVNDKKVLLQFSILIRLLIWLFQLQIWPQTQAIIK